MDPDEVAGGRQGVSQGEGGDAGGAAQAALEVVEEGDAAGGVGVVLAAEGDGGG